MTSFLDCIIYLDIFQGLGKGHQMSCVCFFSNNSSKTGLKYIMVKFLSASNKFTIILSLLGIFTRVAIWNCVVTAGLTVN